MEHIVPHEMWCARYGPYPQHSGKPCNCPVKIVRELEAENRRLQDAIQSRHDYGPASPGEQEAAWISYCQRSGWNPNEHPSAKNAYVEGFCDGDSYSEGDEGRAVLREENQRLQAEIKRFKSDGVPVVIRDAVIDKLREELKAAKLTYEQYREWAEQMKATLDAVVESAITDSDTCAICLQDMVRHASGCSIEAARRWL